MTPPKPTTLGDLGRELPALLDSLNDAMNPDASAEVQSKAFDLGCSSLTSLVDLLTQKGAGLADLLGQVEGFDVRIRESKFGDFVAKEVELLRHLKLGKDDLARAERMLREIQAESGSSPADSAQAMKALQEFRDILCGIKVLTGTRKRKVSTALIRVCADGVIDVCVVTGDVIVASAATGIALGTGPAGWGFFGTCLLAVGSVRSGIQSLRKNIPKAQELFSVERTNLRLDDLKKQPPRK